MSREIMTDKLNSAGDYKTWWIELQAVLSQAETYGLNAEARTYLCELLLAIASEGNKAKITIQGTVALGALPRGEVKGNCVFTMTKSVISFETYEGDEMSEVHIHIWIVE